jgi:hypothetical protein
VLVEGENNESWSWFLRLVKKEVLGPDRSIYMISDRHRGLLNDAKDPIDGYPPLIHRWFSRHFAANIWKKQRSKEVIARLKTLYKVKKEKNLRLDWKSWRRYSMMMKRLGCCSNGQRNLSGLLLLTRVVLDMG